MPDPLLGFALQSFAPLVQPFAVSGVVALLVLERLSVPPESRPPVALFHARPRPNASAHDEAEHSGKRLLS
jgi:hypothetical protein